MIFECDKEDTRLKLRMRVVVRAWMRVDDGGVVREDEGGDGDEDEIWTDERR